MTSYYRWRGRSPRQNLEAVIWRWWPVRGPEAVHAVDAILAAADTYARETAARAAPPGDPAAPADHPAATAARRAELGDAVYTTTKGTRR